MAGEQIYRVVHLYAYLNVETEILCHFRLKIAFNVIII